MRIMDERSVATAADLLGLDEPGHRLELVRGELLRVTGPGQWHGVVAMRIGARLAVYVESRSLGVVFAAETGFWVESEPDTVLCPDVAFVAAGRLGQLRDHGWFQGTPDLVVEVVSPSTSFTTAQQKALAWLGHGSRVVWNVDPVAEAVTVYRSRDEVRVRRSGDELDGADVVPGFALPVAELFRPPPSPPT